VARGLPAAPDDSYRSLVSSKRTKKGTLLGQTVVRFAWSNHTQHRIRRLGLHLQSTSFSF
ncbi:uncharacterized protein METZ01_LOCUS103021, partial [marine metagenome]